MRARESGFEIGRALECRNYKRAQALLENAIVHGMHQATVRDYTEPLANLIPDARVVNFFESNGAETVEQFYRTNPRTFREESEKVYTSKTEIRRASGIVYKKYGIRLHNPCTRLSERAIECLLAADILNQWDIANVKATRIADALFRDVALMREVADLQRKLL